MYQSPSMLFWIWDVWVWLMCRPPYCDLVVYSVDMFSECFLTRREWWHIYIFKRFYPSFRADVIDFCVPDNVHISKAWFSVDSTGELFQFLMQLFRHRPINPKLAQRLFIFRWFLDDFEWLHFSMTFQCTCGVTASESMQCEQCCTLCLCVLLHHVCDVHYLLFVSSANVE